MYNYRFGDDGFSFIDKVIENIKFAWKPYLIILLVTTLVPFGIALIPAGMIAFSALTNNGVMSAMSIIMTILVSIICGLISLVGTTAIIKCINDVDVESGYLPSAAECLSFGVSKLGKLIVYGLLIIAITLILAIPVAIVCGLIAVFTLGLGILLMVPIFLIFGILLNIIYTVSVTNMVIYDMGIIESISDAFGKIRDGFKENILLTLKIILGCILVAVVSAILGWIPIIGWILTTVISSVFNLGITITLINRFFKSEHIEYDMY